MNRATAIDTVVFDLDGTLVDTVPDLASALDRVLAELGRAPVPLADIRAMIGDGAARLVERGLAASGGVPSEAVLADAVRRFLAHYEAAVADRSRPFPDAEACLERLARDETKLGMCTNKPDAATERLLEALGLRRWFAVIGGGDGPFRKPDPRHLLGVIERLGGTPDRAVMVGDGPNDVAAARAAGVRIVLVSYGYTQVPAARLGADAVIDGLGLLPALVADWPGAAR